MTRRRYRNPFPLFKRGVLTGEWFTSEFWDAPDGSVTRPQLLIRRDTWAGRGWYASRWSRRRDDWVPVRGSHAASRHDTAIRAFAAINPDDDFARQVIELNPRRFAR